MLTSSERQVSIIICILIIMALVDRRIPVLVTLTKPRLGSSVVVGVNGEARFQHGLINYTAVEPSHRSRLTNLDGL